MSKSINQELHNKLSAARTRLILDKPFLGALVLRLPMIEADPKWCNTTATDAKQFFYNPNFIKDLKAEETQFVLAHEALHCALSHFARRGHRIKNKWDMACDYAINPILRDEGLLMPLGSLYMPTYKGMTAEEIYPLLKDNEHSETLDQHLYDKQDEVEGGNQNETNPLDQQQKQPPPGENSSDGGSRSEHDPQAGSDQSQLKSEAGQPQNSTTDEIANTAPDPLNNQEKQDLHVQWQQRLAGAAQQAQQAGKLSEGMARMVDFFLQPTLPWRMILAQHMNSFSRDDYSYTRPSSRRGNPAIYPSLRSPQMNVVVALDVSGSIKRKLLSEFISEIDSLKAQVRARVSLLTCDSRITSGSPWVYETWEKCELPEKIMGGGSTDFNPVFDWVNDNQQQPDLLIYFTDADGVFPEIEPTYPVVWLVQGKSKIPWGNRIQLN